MLTLIITAACSTNSGIPLGTDGPGDTVIPFDDDTGDPETDADTDSDTDSDTDADTDSDTDTAPSEEVSLDNVSPRYGSEGTTLTLTGDFPDEVSFEFVF